MSHNKVEMENGVVTVLYFFTLFYGKQEGNPSSHFMTFGTPSSPVDRRF